MRLHATDLFLQAVPALNGQALLRVERTIKDVKDELPFFVFPSPGRLEISSRPGHVDALAGNSDAVFELDGLVSSRRGLLGRLTSEGRDLGVDLQYASGVVIEKEVLLQVADHLSQSLDTLAADLSGRIQLRRDAVIFVDATRATPAQRIWIDDRMVEIPPGESRATVTLNAGVHSVRWSFVFSGLTRAHLRLTDQRNQPIPIYFPELSGRLPLRTTSELRIH